MKQWTALRLHIYLAIRSNGMRVQVSGKEKKKEMLRPLNK